MEEEEQKHVSKFDKLHSQVDQQVKDKWEQE
jgi:hypothetical protein